MRPSAKINDAAGEAFVHGHVSFAGKRIFRMKPRAVTADAPFVAKRERERLAEREAAILDRVMGVHFQIAAAAQMQIHGCVLREKREHVVEERDAGFDRGFSPAVNIKSDGDAGFFGVARDFCLPGFHGGD